MIVLIVQYFGKPGSTSEVASGLERMARLVKEHEPGCLRYEASQALDLPDEWVLYEVYQDESAMEQHRSTEHFRTIIEGTIAPLLDRRMRRVYRMAIM